MIRPVCPKCGAPMPWSGRQQCRVCLWPYEAPKPFTRGRYWRPTSGRTVGLVVDGRKGKRQTLPDAFYDAASKARGPGLSDALVPRDGRKDAPLESDESFRNRLAKKWWDEVGGDSFGQWHLQQSIGKALDDFAMVHGYEPRRDAPRDEPAQWWQHRTPNACKPSVDLRAIVAHLAKSFPMTGHVVTDLGGGDVLLQQFMPKGTEWSEGKVCGGKDDGMGAGDALATSDLRRVDPSVLRVHVRTSVGFATELENRAANKQGVKSPPNGCVDSVAIAPRETFSRAHIEAAVRELERRNGPTLGQYYTEMRWNRVEAPRHDGLAEMLYADGSSKPLWESKP